MFRYYFLISDRSALTRDPNFAIFEQNTFLPSDFSPGGGGDATLNHSPESWPESHRAQGLNTP